MATLQARIEGYVGQLTSTATLPDALAVEASFLIRNYSAERLVEFANIAQIVGNEGFSIEETRVVKAYRNGYEATFVPSNTRLTDPDSLYYATARTPVYEIDKREGDYKVYLHPYANEFEPGLVYRVPYPKSISLSSANVNVYPNEPIIPFEATEAVVLSGAAHEMAYRISNSVAKLGSAFYTSPTAPVLVPSALPDSPDIYSNAVTAQVATGISGLDTNIVAVGNIANPSLPVLTLDFSPVTTALADDDFEKSRSELDNLQQQISEYASEASVVLDEWKGSVVQSYLSNVEAKITQARLNADLVAQYASRADQTNTANEARALEARYRDYEMELQRYQVSFTEQVREIELFAARVQDEAQAYADKAARTSTEIQANQNQLVALQGLYQQQLQKLGFVAQPQPTE